MFLVSALLTVAIDAALGWNRYFRFVVSSTDCNATWAASKHMLATLCLQCWSEISSMGLSLVGVRSSVDRTVSCCFTSLSRSWADKWWSLLSRFHPRIATVLVTDMGSLSLSMAASNAIGYCSSLKIVASSGACNLGSLSKLLRSLWACLLSSNLFMMTAECTLVATKEWTNSLSL